MAKTPVGRRKNPEPQKQRLSKGKLRKYDPSRIADDGYIYTPYITVKGKVIYHPTGGVFKFLPS